MNPSNQYKMYSITKTARLMRIGKDTLYWLIREGKIGTIKVKMREKISAAEIERFQTENTIRKEIKESKRQNLLQKAGPSNGKEIFKSIKEEYLYGKCI